MTDLSECCAILYHISFYISSQDEKIKKYFDTTIMINHNKTKCLLRAISIQKLSHILAN